MRTYKFRAWDSVKKVFPFIGFHILGECCAFDLIRQYELEELNNLVISQFTGLVDKSGKEIYEGDILLINGYDCLSETYTLTKGVVCFQHGCFITKDLGKYKIEQNAGTLIDDERHLEIIGNIFENEKLLKL